MTSGIRTTLNRLKSIYYDSDIVTNLRDTLPDAELVANLRCGIWYCKDQGVKTCYFKSTDGHNNHWGFNTRRLNIDLLKMAFTTPAVIIVDSTANRRKIYPDALSKTLPIWAYIMNMYIDKLFKVEMDDKCSIQLPRFISDTERMNLMQCLHINKEKWVFELQTILDEKTAQSIMELVVASGYKRLVPMFVSSLDIFNKEYYQNIINNNNIPLICLSVGNNDSIFMENQIDRQFNYILGAGDDEEMWSLGLTSELFWMNTNLYLECVDDTMLHENITSTLSTIKYVKDVSILSLFDGAVSCVEQSASDNRHPNMFSIRVITSIANFNKNIGIYDVKENNCLIDIIHKTNRLIHTLGRYTITHIEFICNNFRVSLAVLVSIMVKFRDITFNTDLHISDNQPITKEYIRKIISYVYRFSESFQIPRDFCKQLNKYYIDVY